MQFLDAMDIDGSTALHLAIEKGNEFIITFLLEKGWHNLVWCHLPTLTYMGLKQPTLHRQ